MKSTVSFFKVLRLTRTKTFFIVIAIVTIISLSIDRVVSKEETEATPSGKTDQSQIESQKVQPDSLVDKKLSESNEVNEINNNKPEPSGSPQKIPARKPTSRAAASSSNGVKNNSNTKGTTNIQDIPVQQIIDLINAERAKNNLRQVSANALLNNAAIQKSQHMLTNNYFAHTAPDGTKDVKFVNIVGYKYRAVGINLAKGDFQDPNRLVQAWMNSDGHKQNILADFGQEIGIGVAGNYYTMIIAKPV